MPIEKCDESGFLKSSGDPEVSVSLSTGGPRGVSEIEIGGDELWRP